MSVTDASDQGSTPTTQESTTSRQDTTPTPCYACGAMVPASLEDGEIVHKCLACGALNEPNTSELERCCRLVIEAGYSTGHADTAYGLVEELIDQLKTANAARHALGEECGKHIGTMEQIIQMAEYDLGRR